MKSIWVWFYLAVFGLFATGCKSKWEQMLEDSIAYRESLPDPWATEAKLSDVIQAARSDLSPYVDSGGGEYKIDFGSYADSLEQTDPATYQYLNADGEPTEAGLVAEVLYYGLDEANANYGAEQAYSAAGYGGAWNLSWWGFTNCFSGAWADYAVEELEAGTLPEPLAYAADDTYELADWAADTLETYPGFCLSAIWGEPFVWIDPLQ